MEYANIYKICCKDANIKDIYVGSSVDCRNRFYQHKCTYNKGDERALYNCIRNNGGFDNWTYEILERTEKSQQRVREQYWIETLNTSLNERRAFTDEEIKKQQAKEYTEKNKEEIARKKKEHRSKPEIKEREKEQARIWRENNKEKHNQLTKEWREQNKEHVSEYRRKYYEENKEKLNAKRRELYALKKQTA